MKKTLVGILVFLSSVAFAQDEQTTTRGMTEGMRFDRGATPPVGIKPFIGLGAGYVPENDEVEIEGGSAEAKLLGSWYPQNQRSVFDLGFGTMGHDFAEDNTAEENFNSGFLEAAARYQWANRWQAGIVGNTFFDKGEFYNANQADAQFGGLQVVKEWGMQNGGLFRLGARAMQDLNVDDQEIYLGMIDIAFGWDVGGGRTATAANMSDRPSDMSTTSATDESDVAGADTPTTSPEVEGSGSAVAGDDMTSESGMAGAGVSSGSAASDSSSSEVELGQLTGETALVTFDTNSSDLKSDDEKKAEHIAEALSQHKDLYERVEVVGFADKSGTEDANLDISRERAASVAEVLEDKGLESDKISVVGMGSANASGTSMEDRKVEIRLIGVKDINQIQQALSDVASR